jgi:ATP/maltotriose-dependent transcriptional regulator MalT
MGDIPGGVALLDEAMVAIAAGEVSPIIAGDVYCSMIEACSELFDMRRAHEWTAALSNWCEGQPDLVLYRGQCLIHRAEIMQLHGEWPDAMHEIELARARLADPPSQMAIGSACYQQGELHRLVGEFASAEDAYRAASQAGHEPQPGWALLRLAQGQTDAAAAAIRRVVDEADDPSARSRMLPPCVEILLAADDAHTARNAADELTKIAAELDAPLLHATSAHATGAVLLAEGDARAALVALRTAWSRWRELDVPYEAARVRVLLGLACRALGDEDSAEMEFDAARSVFDQLHAASELQRVDALSGRTAAKDAGGLSTREIEVIALVATGKTNKAIATELIISEKTVARHVSNIFTKLGVSSRAAATAYAYEHDLVQH